MKYTFMIIVGTAFLLAGCSRQDAVVVREQVVIPATNANITAEPLRVESIAVTPETLHRGQPAQVAVKLDRTAPARNVTLAWFGPDGWLVSDEMRSASSETLTFNVPTKKFDEPGTYRAELRQTKNALRLADVTVDVTG